MRKLKLLYEEQQELRAQELSRFLLNLQRRRKTGGVLGEREFRKLLAAYHAIPGEGRRRHRRQEGRALGFVAQPRCGWASLWDAYPE